MYDFIGGDGTKSETLFVVWQKCFLNCWRTQNFCRLSSSKEVFNMDEILISRNKRSRIVQATVIIICQSKAQSPALHIWNRLYLQTFCCGFKSSRVRLYASSFGFQASKRIRGNDKNAL